MAKKKKEVKESEPKKKQMTLDDIIVGMTVPDLHDVDMEITDDLLMEMVQYETETKKSPIYRNKITGSFLFWQMPKNNKKPKDTKKILEQAIEDVTEIEQEIEAELIDEENLILDAMEDYRMEFNVKKVNTNTKKWKTFFEEWKQAE